MEQQIRIPLPSVDSTLALGRAIGLAVATQATDGHPLPFILLYGGLGCGKTTLTRGLVEALPGGAGAEVCSPSFTVCNSYPTIPPVLHADLYRDEDQDGMSASGLPDEAWELLETDSSALILVEWAQRLRQKDLPSEHLDITMESTQDMHTATLTSFGAQALAVLTELAGLASSQR